jgi:hypothetical protein
MIAEIIVVLLAAVLVLLLASTIRAYTAGLSVSEYLAPKFSRVVGSFVLTILGLVLLEAMDVSREYLEMIRLMAIGIPVAISLISNG